MGVRPSEVIPPVVPATDGDGRTTVAGAARPHPGATRRGAAEAREAPVLDVPVADRLATLAPRGRWNRICPTIWKRKNSIRLFVEIC